MDKPNSEVVKTGITGLDDVLFGGLPAFRQYLIEGWPGTGKTTLGMQFLMEGRRLGEKCLYITLSESEEELQQVARSHGWNLDGIQIYELQTAESRSEPEDDYTVFRPEEVELSETVQEVCRLVERQRPARAVFDSLSELHLLARDPLRYRRQILGLKRFFSGKHCTVLLLDDKSGPDSGLQLQTLSHGVITLERLGQEYGGSRRRLNIGKLRGAKFRDGFHDYAIETGGIRVYPRLVASEHRTEHQTFVLSSGVPELDQLLGGGLSCGTSTLIVGPAGTGKSTIAGAYSRSAAQKGLHASVFIFEETRQTYIERMAGVSLSLADGLRDGLIVLQQVDPAELSPGQFTQVIRDEVEQAGSRLLVIDSLNGYLNAMPGERFLTTHLHEVLMYLGEKNVATMLIGAYQGVIGAQMFTPVDASYLADAVVMLRYYENRGAVHQAISVMKKRGGQHERTIREFSIERGGMHVGEPLRNFRGVLTGVPTLDPYGDLEGMPRSDSRRRK